MTLDNIFIANGTDKGSTGHSFSRWYEPLFEPLRDRPITICEAGVQFGCSIRAWLSYFPLAAVYGVCGKSEHGITDPRFHFQVGNQEDKGMWERWKQENPKLNICIDDCAHQAAASKVMLEALWPHLLSGGIYIIEDVCCFWDNDFASSVNGPDWLRDLIGAVNWRGKQYGGKPHPTQFVLNDFEATVDSIHFSKHLVIITKK